MTDPPSKEAPKVPTVTDLPAYLKAHPCRLPKGGPDRVRFCLMYGDYIAEGKDDEEARRSAFGSLRLLYYYVLAGIADKLGPTCAGIPIEFLGED